MIKVKKEALLMYIYGEKLTRICKKLNIYMSDLNKWIKEIERPKKQKVKIKTKNGTKAAMRTPNSNICKNAISTIQ